MEKGQRVDTVKYSPPCATNDTPSTLRVHSSASQYAQPQPSYNNPSNNVAPIQGPQSSNQPSCQPVADRGMRNAEKSIVEAYILAVSPFGLLGAHHFYLRRYYWGIVYFFTLGLLGCGYLIDWFRVPCLVKEANAKNAGHIPKDKRSISDAYTLWFPFGLLGFHHYYLGNYAWGVAYTCTLGLVGIGWLVDLFRMPYLVRDANKRQANMNPLEKSPCLTVALGLSPLGALGAHHYYLNRPVWGILYTFTLGLMGWGWLCDWFRMPLLIIRTNKVARGLRMPDLRTVDDAYILWLPFGLLGFHHFYLGRPLWGILYFCTLGLVGMGWLIDLCRIPFLVKDYNKRMEEELERRKLDESRQANITILTSSQGYPTYGIVNPGAYTPNQPPAPYPPQGPYNPQQSGGAYNPQQSGGPYNPQQSGYPYGGQQTPIDGNNPYTPPTGFAPPAYGSSPRYPPNMGDVAPPPYEPRAPEATSQEAPPLPGKH